MKKIILMVLIFCSWGFLQAQSNKELFIESGEKLIYKIKVKGKEDYQHTVTYFSQKEVGQLFYSYKSVDIHSRWEVKTDNRAYPLKIDLFAKGNEVHLSFDGRGKVNMQGYLNGKKIDTRAQFKPNVSLENALIVRSLDLNSPEKYSFDLLQFDKFPKLEAFPMFFQVEDDVVVSVEAGTFKCKKVLFSLNDWRSLFYKAYYYISYDEHHYIVKIENVPKDGSTELIKIVRPGK